MALPAGLTKSVTAHGTVIWEQETEYQYARVIEDSDGERRLELNEGQAVHSVYTPGEYLTGGYWDEMLVLPFAAPEAPQDVAILGSAAGTTARALAHYWPDVHVDAVEIDPAVTEVGRDLFDLHGANIATHAADARPWLHASDRQYDAILVDAYRQPYIPFYLTTRDFFGLVRAHLRPGGVVVINVGHPADSDTLEKVLTATMRTEFGDDHVLRDPSHPTNTLLLGTTAVDPRQHLIEASTTMPPEVADVARATALRLQDGLDGGDVYTDDKAPVEWLVDASLAAEAE
jgi:spermidine synthase